MKTMARLRYHFGLKIRVYPSYQQKRVIKVNSNASRFAYNHLIGLSQKEWYLRHTPCWNPFEHQASLERMKVQYKMKWLKTAYQFMNDKYIDSLALAEVTNNYHRAWYNYKNGLQRVPTFHTKKQHPYEFKYQTACLYHKYKNGHRGSVRLLDKHHLLLPKLGKIRANHLRSLIWNKRYELRIGTVTISKNPQNHYYVSLALASDTPFVNKLTDYYRTLGYDLNTSNYAMMSNGTMIDNPHFYKKMRNKLKRVDKIVSRRSRHNQGLKLSHCHNYQKIRLKRARLARHVMNQRKNFLNNLSKKLIEKQDWIFGEDLRSKNLMRNHRMAQSIQDTGWRMFIGMLQWKASMYGKHLILVDPRNTTQTCHQCGYIMSHHGRKIKMGHESWCCPNCRSNHCRDLNAAKNILTRGINKIAFYYYEVLLVTFRMATHGITAWLSYLVTRYTGVMGVSKRVVAD